METENTKKKKKKNEKKQWLVGQMSGDEKGKEAGDEIENINNNACETKKKKVQCQMADGSWMACVWTQKCRHVL